MTGQQNDLETRLNYTQPHNIRPMPWMNQAEGVRYQLQEHNRLKHESRDRVKYLRLKRTTKPYSRNS